MKSLPKASSCSIGVAFLLLFQAHSALAAAPTITSIPDQTASKGVDYTYTPTLSNAGTAGTVNWTKAYGPDDVKVNPATGAISWSIPSNLPGESFHIGLKASNGDGSVVESWIVHVGVPKVVYVGPNETDKTLGAAFAKYTTPGMTFVVRNGTYTGEANAIARISNGSHQYPVQGTASALSTVMAEDPGSVTLSGGAVIDINGIGGPVGYFAVKGFFVKDGYINTTGYDSSVCSYSAGCRPHHIKFIQNGVQSSGEIAFNAFRSDDILMENNYAFGGGRYKFASYQANRVVFRRNVARYDRSNNEMAEPKGTYSIYTTMNATVSNNLAIDGDQSEFVTLGQLAGEYTCPTTSGATRVTFDRNMQLNSEMLYGNIDNQAGPCDAEIKDVVSWDVRPANVYVMTRAGSWFDHVTMGKIAPVSNTAQLFNGWPSNLARGMTNSVIHEITNGGLFYGFTKQSGVTLIDRTVDRYGVDYVNITSTPGTLNVNGSTIGTTFNSSPLYSSSNTTGGLRYLTRIEPNSNLSGKAKDGGDLGATVMTFKGKSGTFYGETGYNTETNQPMWPFPFEDVIKAKMAAYTYTGTTYSGDEYSRVTAGTGTINGARGFAAANQSLTHYVWNYLGNTVPPFNVTAVAGTGQVTLKWDPPATKALATQNGFKVYDYNASTKALSNPRTVAKGTYQYTVTGLANAASSSFAVTAIDSVTGESSYSYVVSATPVEVSPPMPPTVQGVEVVN